MNVRTKTVTALLAFVVLVGSTPSRIVAAEKLPAEAAFERLKSLAGTWETRLDGKPGFATYMVTGGGDRAP
jgi:hypothetical protein